MTSFRQESKKQVPEMKTRREFRQRTGVRMVVRTALLLLLAAIQPRPAVAEIYLPIWGTLKARAGSAAQASGDLVCNGVSLDSPDLACTRTSSSGGYLYAIVLQQDFNGDGAKDTLSFDLRVEGFAGSTYAYSTNANSSSMTALGTSTGVTDLGNRWGVGGDLEVDPGESLRFSVENIACSAGAVVLSGLTSIAIEETNEGYNHKYIIGQGTGLEAYSFNEPSTSFGISGASDGFVITGAGSNVANREWAISSLSFMFRGPLATWDPTDYSYYTVGDTMLDEYPAQTDFTNYPAFSWNTVPRWLIVRKNTAWTASEISAMATNYPIIVWEKANQAGFSTVEAGIVDTSIRVKKINPAVKSIFYRNSGMHYGGYASDATYDQWNYSRKTTDTNGNEVLLYISDQLMYDHDVAGLRNWWVYDSALPTVLHAPVDGIVPIDGIFYDKCGEPGYIYDANGDPVSNYIDMLDTMDQELPPGKLTIGNTLRNERENGSRDLMRLLEGSYLERWELPLSGTGQTRSDATSVSMQLMMEATSKGKIILFKTGANSAASSREEMQANMPYNLALYLMVAGPYSYFAFQDTVAATKAAYQWEASWMPEFSRPLGEPLGQAIKEGYVYNRSFEHLDVRVDVESEATLFAWDSVDSDGDGMDDRWEYRNFGGLTNAVASADADGDGYTNLQEYQAGTAPNEKDPFIAPGLVAHWPLNEMSGSVATDVSGNGFDGTIAGAVWTSGLGGGALQFNGGTDSVVIPAASFNSALSEIAIAMWVYGNTNQPVNDAVFYAMDVASNRVLNIHLPFGNGNVYWDAGFSNTYDRIYTNAGSALSYKGQWNHWVFTKDAAAGTMKIYLNGALWHSGTGKTRTLGGITSAAIGSQMAGSGYSGLIDDVRLYNVALTAGQVADLYRSYALAQGVPVDWMSSHGLLRADDAVLADNDGDGLLNWQEYVAGLNPATGDAFRIAGSVDGMTWNAVSGRVYNVYWSSNLLDGFTLIQSNAPGGAFLDTSHADHPAGYYKLTVGLEP